MEFFVQNLAPIMFAGLIFFLLLGFPVAFSLGACGLGGCLTTTVADGFEGAAVVLQLKVVPILATHIQTAVAVFELQPVHTRKKLRKGLTSFEVQTTVVRHFRVTFAAIIGPDQMLIGLGRRPTGANRQFRINLTFDFANIEAHTPCRPGQRRSEADCQRQFGSAPELVD